MEPTYILDGPISLLGLVSGLTLTTRKKKKLPLSFSAKNKRQNTPSNNKNNKKEEREWVWERERERTNSNQNKHVLHCFNLPPLSPPQTQRILPPPPSPPPRLPAANLHTLESSCLIKPARNQDTSNSAIRWEEGAVDELGECRSAAGDCGEEGGACEARTEHVECRGPYPGQLRFLGAHSKGRISGGDIASDASWWFFRYLFFQVSLFVFL